MLLVNSKSVMSELAKQFLSSLRPLAPKVERVASHLRSQISGGVLMPGSRLPSWDDMARQFKVGRPTLMRALEWLKTDGFIYSDSTRGTFVTERPPHLCRYGLVFTSGPGEQWWNRYWQALAAEAARIERTQNSQVPLFYHVTSHADDETSARLAREIRSHRLAGIICAGDSSLCDSPLWGEADVPPIVVLGPRPLSVAKSVALEVDRDSFVRRSLEWMQQQGRKRIAILTEPTQTFPQYRTELTAFGMSTKPQWFLMASATAPQAAKNIVHLLLDRDEKNRPDGLIITDDNIVETALSGIVAAGIEVPNELVVVGHCNWPWPVRSVVPIRRLGFDARMVLQEAIAAIDAMRDGQETPPLQLIGATFEEEQVEANSLMTIG